MGGLAKTQKKPSKKGGFFIYQPNIKKNIKSLSKWFLLYFFIAIQGIVVVKNINELKIVNTDFDINTGFFWVEFEGEKSIQCCLKQGQKGKYLRQIDRSNNGSSEGLSGDNNRWALDPETLDWSQIDSILHKEARIMGIKII